MSFPSYGTEVEVYFVTVCPIRPILAPGVGKQRLVRLHPLHTDLLRRLPSRQEVPTPTRLCLSHSWRGRCREIGGEIRNWGERSSKKVVRGVLTDILGPPQPVSPKHQNLIPFTELTQLLLCTSYSWRTLPPTPSRHKIAVTFFGPQTSSHMSL